jgi:phosphoribosylformylglycinamidine synthase II
MLSESQERMLIILEDEKEKDAKKIFDKWDLDFVIIGKTTDTNNLTLMFKNEIVGEIPIDALATKAPMYDRKWTKTKLPEKKINIKDLKKIKLEDAFLKILSLPNQSNKSWVTEQFDQMVMTDTAQKSGADAAIIRIHNKEKAIAVTVDSSANYCKAHPLTGGKQIVCESWRNLISVGAKPIAITNCLNFGNPEDPNVMGQFAECLIGIKEACEFLDYPVVSGNVSFYNGTNKKNINPTPVIGGVGLILESNNRVNHILNKEGNIILQIGKTFGHLYQSVFFKEIYSIYEGPPPDVNLSNEKNNGEIVLKLINNKLITAIHDVSAGGLILALAEMTLSSEYGLKIKKPEKLSNLMEYYFGEDQGRYLLEIEPKDLENVTKILNENNIFNETIATVQKDFFEILGEFKISTNYLYKTNNKWYSSY